MAVAIRGTTPATTAVTSDPMSVSLTGSRQPQTDDVLIIIHCNDFYALSNMPTPTVGGSSSGVTTIVNADAGTDSAHIKSWYYVVGSTGDLTVAVDETGAGDEEKGLAVYVLDGVDTATPIDTSGSAINTGGTTHIAPSVSPTSSDAFLICHASVGGGAGPASYTSPGGMTEAYDVAITAFCMTGATQQLAASGATGTRTFTPITSVANNAEISIAVKTSSAAAAVDSSAYSIARLPGRIGPDGKVFTPGIRFDNNGTVAEITGTVTETQDNQTSTATGVLGYTGTVAETQDNQTSTATGILGYSGSVAETQDNQTSTATGTLGYSGSVAETQDNQTSTASGSVAGGGEVTGSLAETQDNQTSTSSGVLGYSGTVARTQANQTSTASGSISISGTVSRTQANQTASASGVLGYSGTLARTQINQTASAAGWISITGTIARTQDNQTSSGSGFIGQFLTPLIRTYEIPADPRELRLREDARTHQIPADLRDFVLQADDRTDQVPADARILVAPGEA